MKSAELEQKLEEIEFKGWVQMTDRPSFSARMIAELINHSCPLESVSLRRVQQVAKHLTDIGTPSLQSPQMCGKTPYYSRRATEMVLIKLKFKVKQ
jgi:hypothetical protein